MMLDAPLCWLMILGHLLGDYYFQTERMADGKRGHAGWLLLHCLLYAVAMLAALSPVLLAGTATREASLWLLALTAGSHAVIDCVKALIERREAKDPPRRNRAVFLIDQTLHIAFILGAVAWFGGAHGQVSLNVWGEMLRDGLAALGIPELTGPMQALRLLCTLLMIGKPANVAIRVIIAKREPQGRAKKPARQQPQQRRTTLLTGRPLDVLVQVMEPPQAGEGEAEEDDPEAAQERAEEQARTGRWIGVLERVLVVVLMMMGEYGAIGLVFTAKSLTRFERIAKDKGFAEYYLIGTLASILFAMAALFVARPMA